MSDATIRKGGRLIDRLRAGLLVPAYTVARDVACGACTQGRVRSEKNDMWVGHTPCNGKGRVPYDPTGRSFLRLLAFLGVEEAREIVEWNEDPRRNLLSWTNELQHLASPLPPKRVEVACGARSRSWVYRMCSAFDCEVCNGTGKVTTDTPAEQWLMVVAVVAVGRVVWANRKNPGGPGGGPAQMLHGRFVNEQRRIGKALTAGDAWLDEPTPERATLWVGRVQGAPDWVPRFGLAGRALQSAAEILDPKPIASAAILSVL